MKKTTRKLKLTPWYSGVTPLKSRPGWYKDFLRNTMLWWDGTEWYVSPYDMLNPLWVQDRKWRGVQR